MTISLVFLWRIFFFKYIKLDYFYFSAFDLEMKTAERNMAWGEEQVKKVLIKY